MDKDARRDSILVALDFEPISEAALEAAAELSQRLGWQLVLLHVAGTPAYAHPEVGAPYLAGVEDDLLRDAQRALGRAASGLPSARAMVREGDPATEILRAIHEIRPRLVCLGTHGRRGLSRVLLGSVAERVVRESPVPVLTLRGPAAPTGAAAARTR